jgi:hypothetical protein
MDTLFWTFSLTLTLILDEINVCLTTLSHFKWNLFSKYEEVSVWENVEKKVLLATALIWVTEVRITHVNFDINQFLSTNVILMLVRLGSTRNVDIDGSDTLIWMNLNSKSLNCVNMNFIWYDHFIYRLKNIAISLLYNLRLKNVITPLFDRFLNPLIHTTRQFVWEKRKSFLNFSKMLISIFFIYSICPLFY